MWEIVVQLATIVASAVMITLALWLQVIGSERIVLRRRFVSGLIMVASGAFLTVVFVAVVIGVIFYEPGRNGRFDFTWPSFIVSATITGLVFICIPSRHHV